jgi:hypothetical protein
MTESGWTSKELLNEAAQLLKEYDLAETQKEKDEINGCFLAVQEVVLAKGRLK